MVFRRTHLHCRLKYGVRQGGVLSLLLFSIHVDCIVEKLRMSNKGCYINQQFWGCILYANDILLLSASVFDLQDMIDIRACVLKELDMILNVDICNIIRIGNSC